MNASNGTAGDRAILLTPCPPQKTLFLHAALSGGDRFKELSLLADRNQTDYYTIASRRIRDIQPNREPEINQYYEFYCNNFKFLRLNNINYEQFVDRFPFQPRAFDIIRRITRENLPSARFGIGVLYDILKRGELLQQNRLIIASDLLKSSSLTDGFKDTLYEDSYKAYQEAKDNLTEMEEIEASERLVADNILGSLFLEHIAYLDSGIEHWLKVSDIVEATLTQSDVLMSEDTIDYPKGEASTHQEFIQLSLFD